jgi:glucosamine--fructose-6-phosphate aminotransferase (isomerizing)
MRQTLKKLVTTGLRAFHHLIQSSVCRLHLYFTANVYIGKSLSRVPPGSLVFFPLREDIFYCGIAGMVTFTQKAPSDDRIDVEALEKMLQTIASHGCESCRIDDAAKVEARYLGGKDLIERLWRSVQGMKQGDLFYAIFSDPKIQNSLAQLTKQLTEIVESETIGLTDQMGHLEVSKVDAISGRIERLKDIAWCLDIEIAANIKKLETLMNSATTPPKVQYRR